MLVQSFYLTTSLDKVEDPKFEIEKMHGKVRVPKLGKFLYGLKPNHDIIYSVITTPSSVITEDGNFLNITNAIIRDRQCLSIGLVDTIVRIHQEDPYGNNGAILFWAFEHEFRSVFLNYLGKYPTMSKFIEPIIYSYLQDKSNWHNDMMIWVIDRYKYDIFKDDNRLFTMAAMCKNARLCEYLLEEKNAVIPVNVYNIFMQYGKKKFGFMYNLLNKFSDRVVLS